MLNIMPVRAFSDNYIWLIQDQERRYAAIVDPGDAGPVLKVLAEEGVTPIAILITHHHGDHVGGIARLKQHYPALVAYGPASERIRGVDYPLEEDDTVSLPEIDAAFEVLEVPGHTAGHIAYFGHGSLFCGDTVFACGCGRLFEGTPEQMQASLSKIATLPGDTRLYCAHEYTLDNIAFAKWVEPNNPDLLQREVDAQALRAQGKPTVPSLLELELRTNPFLRYHEPTVVRAAERFAGRSLSTKHEVFGAVRHWKDTEFD
jgi:hydroxyacylglutathione hydrolase